MHTNPTNAPGAAPAAGDASARNADAADPTFDFILSPRDRLRGLLLGGAVGDALGAPVEFMRRREILERFGPMGVTRFAPAYGRLGAITDDTQMTLFTVEGVLRAVMRYAEKGICNPLSVIERAYLRWYATQGHMPPADFEIDGWLSQQQALNAQRAPGTTCLDSLGAKRWRVRGAADNHSKGAGAIMRVAPVGLLMADDPFDLACEVAGLTHGHITGQVAAGWFASWVQAVGQGLSLRGAALGAWRRCRGRAPELDAALAQAFELVGQGPADQVPAALGEGWVAEEAAAIAVWCVLTALDPFEAVRLAVNIDGDSDTTGSLVGQLLGAARGPGWIPPELLAQLEFAEEVEALAADATEIVWDNLGRDSDTFATLWERYPGW
jgi:ADP-ribosyl-[dinitrogen reductase] hydrolase